MSCSDKGWSAGSSKAGSMSWGWGSLLGGEFWESKLSLEELFGLLSQDWRVWLDDSLDDMDGITSGTMSTSHLLVHAGDGTVESGWSVFFVHVDNISSSGILKDDSEVLDGTSLLFKDFRDGDDLTLALSNLVLSFHFIPEVGSSENNVLGEDSNSEAGWFWSGFTWKFSSDNPELFDLNKQNKDD